MTAVTPPCDRCNRPTPAAAGPAVHGFHLCDDCLEDLAGDGRGTGPERASAASPADALSEALAALLSVPRRRGRGKRRRTSAPARGV